MFDAKIKELIALGASVSANCHSCIKHHVKKARELKIDEAEIQQALDIGQVVKKSLTTQTNELISEITKQIDVIG